MPTVLNSNANLEGKTIVAAENADTITGLKTFDRDPDPPFAVSASSAVVPNLDADKVDGIEGTDLVKKDGTVAMTGTLDLGTPGKIKFPAAQSASADANTLDDYEEGSFTPTITSAGGGAATYSTQVGRYIKVGRLVKFTARIDLATKGTLAAGTVSISGLPFTTDATASTHGSVVIGYFVNMTTAVVNLTGLIAPNETRVQLHQLTAAATGVTATTVADIGATLVVILSGFYFATA